MVQGVSSTGEATLGLGPPWLATDSTDPYNTPDPSPPLPGSLLACSDLPFTVCYFRLDRVCSLPNSFWYRSDALSPSTRDLAVQLTAHASVLAPTLYRPQGSRYFPFVPLIHGASSLRTHRYRSTLFPRGLLKSKVQSDTVSSRCVSFVHAPLPFDLFALGPLESKVQCGTVSSRCVSFVHATLPSDLLALGPLESKAQCVTVNSRSHRFALHRGCC